MTTVTVTIAGRSYRMVCGEGEEARLQQLARHVDGVLAGLRKGFGEIGDMRLAVMTAITVADDLFEARRRVGELEAVLTELTASRAEGETVRDQLAGELAASLDAAAERIERIARHLNEAGKG